MRDLHLFPSKGFVVLALTFRSLIHRYGVREGANIILLQRDILVSQTFVENPPLSPVALC